MTARHSQRLILLWLICLLSIFSCQQRYAHRAKVKMPQKERAEKQQKKPDQAEAFVSDEDHRLHEDSLILNQETIADPSIHEGCIPKPPFADKRLNTAPKSKINATSPFKKTPHQKRKSGPPIAVLFLAILIFSLVIFLPVNASRHKKEKPKEADDSAPPPDIPNPKNDAWMRRFAILFGILAAVFIVFTLLGLMLFFGSFVLGLFVFWASIEVSSVLIMFLLVLLMALITLAYILTEKHVERRIQPFDKNQFTREYILILILVIGLFFIPIVGIFIDLGLLILALAWLRYDAQTRTKI